MLRINRVPDYRTLRHATFAKVVAFFHSSDALAPIAGTYAFDFRHELNFVCHTSYGVGRRCDHGMKASDCL